MSDEEGAAPLSIYPAIDLADGKCVRLFQGRMEEATVYNDDPGDQAAQFRDAGFDRIHIVDLDGAFSGESKNRAAVEAILARAPGWRQLGGGVRNMAALDGWIEAGVDRVVLGTAAVRDPAFVRTAAKTHPGRVAIGVDAVDGLVKTDGWAGHTSHTASDLAKRYEDEGVAALIYTDVSRDGAMTGVNVAATSALAAAVDIPVIASGGVAGAGDIEALATSRPLIEGVIVGRALYENAVSPSAALRAARRSR